MFVIRGIILVLSQSEASLLLYTIYIIYKFHTNFHSNIIISNIKVLTDQWKKARMLMYQPKCVHVTAPNTLTIMPRPNTRPNIPPRIATCDFKQIISVDIFD